MSVTISPAELDKGAQGARALLALVGAPKSETKAATLLKTASPKASDNDDDYERGAAEARRLLDVKTAPTDAAKAGAPSRSTAGASSLRSGSDDDPRERAKGAAEARRLLGMKTASV